MEEREERRFEPYTGKELVIVVCKFIGYLLATFVLYDVFYTGPEFSLLAFFLFFLSIYFWRVTLAFIKLIFQFLGFLLMMFLW